MCINNQDEEPITVYGEPLEHVLDFVYLGSVVDVSGSTNANIKDRKGKARAAFKKQCWTLNQNQTKDFQLHSKACSSLLLRDIENERNSNQEALEFHQCILEENPEDPLARADQQHSIMGTNKEDSSKR